MTDATQPPLSIYGGAGGERAVTEDLERGAGMLMRAAQELREAGKALRTAAWIAEDAYPRALPEVAPYVFDAKEAAWDALRGRHGALALEREVEDVGARLQVVAATFLTAEHAAHRGVTAAGSTWRSAGDLAAAWAWWARTSSGGLARLAGQDELAELIDPEYALPTSGVLSRRAVEANLGALQAAGVYAPVRMALLAAARIAEVLLGEARLVDVASRRSEIDEPITSLAGVGEVLLELDGVYPREVAIDKVVDAQGNVSWIVAIPGTGDTVTANGEVVDVVSDMENVDGSTSDATDLVLAAMAEAGIGEDEPVLLAGHSAGGMIASVLAASGSSPYSVKAVVTVGSPVGDITHQPGVAYLHVENEPDLVPALDGRRNPDGPSTVTALFDSRTFADPEVAAASRTVIGAHHASTYAQGLALLDANTSASMQAWREETAGFFSPAATVERTVVSQVHGPEPTNPGPPREPQRLPRPFEPDWSPSAPGEALRNGTLSPGGIPALRP